MTTLTNDPKSEGLFLENWRTEGELKPKSHVHYL